MKFNVRSFPAYHFDIAVEQNALYETYLEDLADKLNEKGTSAISAFKKTRLRESFFGKFRSIHKSKVMGISAVETGNADFPDGYTSFQSMMGIAAPPSHASTAVNSFTYLVDQAIGVDADFALRIQPAPDAVSKNTASEVLGDLKSEDAANSKNELDADEYADAIENVFNLRDAVRAESNPTGMKVTALFAFGHPDLNELKRRSAALTKTFATNGFTTYQAPGGQFDMWQQMMPGVRRSRLTDDLSMVTTSYLFSGCMPVRRTVAGDTQGLPIAINAENALGQLVLWDILNSTDKGNASQVVCGAQGSGKSHLIKMMLGYMIDLKRYVYLIDQHKHGEYEVYASTLTDTEVFNVTGRTGSLDPFKVYEDHELAEKVFMDLWIPLLGLDPDRDSAMITILSRMVKLEYRKPRGLTSTRKLIDYIVSRGTEQASPELAAKFEIWGELSYCSALIDPVEYGQVIDLPAFNSSKRCVVFRTHELSVYRGNNIAEASPSERYAAVVYNAIARLAAHRFSQIKGACAFIGDELHFLDGNDRVLDTLIRTPDRTGRKDGNFVIGGSQLAGDFGSQYDMIKRKFALRQETEPNAVEALEWVGAPATNFLTDRMLNDTSPPDPDDNNRPTKGREGEGWYNDGNGNLIRVKIPDHMREDRKRMSDTTSSRMIRAEDLPAITA
jgi:energy-coupling factor transporter ATP-binding protein EcfA2